MAIGQGMVTSNVVGSTYHPKTPEELANERLYKQRQWEVDDRNWQLQFMEKERLRQEGEAKERYRKMMGQYRQAFDVMNRPQMDSWQRIMQTATPGPTPGTHTINPAAGNIPGNAIGAVASPYGGYSYGGMLIGSQPISPSVSDAALNQMWNQTMAGTIAQGGMPMNPSSTGGYY